VVVDMAPLLADAAGGFSGSYPSAKVAGKSYGVRTRSDVGSSWMPK